MRVTTVGDVSEQVRGVSYSKSEASDVLQPGYSPTLLHGSSRRMPYHCVFQHWG